MPFFQDKWEALSERTRTILEITFGIVFAVICMYFLTRPQQGETGFFDFNIIIAALTVLLLPKVVQTQVGRQLKIMHKAMLISLIVLLLIMSAIYLIPGFEGVRNLLGV